MKNIAVIGAGISGLSYANLSKNNCTIFEQNSFPGGRVVTKEINEYSFDFGSQFFIARDPHFLKFIDPMLKQEVILPWRARFAEIIGDKVISQRVWGDGHFVGSPNMSKVGSYLANGLNIYYNCKIVSLKKEFNKWLLIDQVGKEYGLFDWVVFAVPPIGLSEVLKNVLCDFRHIKMDACYSLMLGFLENIDLDFDAALIKNKDISWISVNSSKPNRYKKTCLLVHSTNKWANNNQLGRDLVIDYLIDQVSSSIDIDLSLVSVKDIHFWHSANIGKRNKEKYVIDWQNKLAFCGDWFIHGRVEAAFLSAYYLINRLEVV